MIMDNGPLTADPVKVKCENVEKMRKVDHLKECCVVSCVELPLFHNFDMCTFTYQKVLSEPSSHMSVHIKTYEI
jgi:hypothetical protein